MSKPVTMELFEEVVDQNSIVLLYFWAAWCQPCKVFAPIYEELSSLNPDIYFGKVDTENATELAQAFQVRSVPTIMAFLKGELVFEQPGLIPAESFAQLVSKLRESVQSIE